MSFSHEILNEVSSGDEHRVDKFVSRGDKIDPFSSEGLWSFLVGSKCDQLVFPVNAIKF